MNNTRKYEVFPFGKSLNLFCDELKEEEKSIFYLDTQDIFVLISAQVEGRRVVRAPRARNKTSGFVSTFLVSTQESTYQPQWLYLGVEGSQLTTEI